MSTANEWQPIDTAPDQESFIVGIWEGTWREPKREFRVYEASWGHRNGRKAGLILPKSYRTEEGAAFKVVGWLPKPKPPEQKV